jgi:hypothetical protein
VSVSLLRVLMIVLIIALTLLLNAKAIVKAIVKAWDDRPNGTVAVAVEKPLEIDSSASVLTAHP